MGAGLATPLLPPPRGPAVRGVLLVLPHGLVRVDRLERQA